MLSVAVGLGCSGFYCGHWTYDPCSVICVQAASAAITPRLNPFAVISIVPNINVKALVPAPGLHRIMLRLTFVT